MCNLPKAAPFWKGSCYKKLLYDEVIWSMENTEKGQNLSEELVDFDTESFLLTYLLGSFG